MNGGALTINRGLASPLAMRTGDDSGGGPLAEVWPRPGSGVSLGCGGTTESGRDRSAEGRVTDASVARVAGSTRPSSAVSATKGVDSNAATTRIGSVLVFIRDA